MLSCFESEKKHLALPIRRVASQVAASHSLEQETRIVDETDAYKRKLRPVSSKLHSSCERQRFGDRGGNSSYSTGCNYCKKGYKRQLKRNRLRFKSLGVFLNGSLFKFAARRFESGPRKTERRAKPNSIRGEESTENPIVNRIFSFDLDDHCF